jgi:hypothetical protein
MQEAVSGVHMIAGYRVLAELGTSKRFQAFRVEMGPQETGFGTLYLMHEALPQVEAFTETVNAIWAAWPFEIPAQRGFVLPEAQVWKNRPWFVIPDSLPVLSSAQNLSSTAAASLKAQLDWLQNFQSTQAAPGEFAHGDVRPKRIAFLAGEAFLVAPGWVAACDRALQRRLTRTRADDAYHLAKLLVQKLDRVGVGTAPTTRPPPPTARRPELPGPAQRPPSATRLDRPTPVAAGVVARSPDAAIKPPAAAPRGAPPALRRPEPAAKPPAKSVPARALSEASRFTLWRTEVLRPSEWTRLLVFTHEEATGAGASLADIARRAERAFAAALGHTPTDAGARLGMPSPTEIVVVPRADDDALEFSPRQQRFVWSEPVQQVEFRVRAEAGLDEASVHGALHVFRGTTLVAELPFDFRVSSRQEQSAPRPATVAAFQRVFAAHAHADAALLAPHGLGVPGLGADEYLREMNTLREGEVWSVALKELIHEADVFQLFWSESSMRSPFVCAEWEYALALGKPICPVFWETPLPADSAARLPPAQLARLQFLDLTGRWHPAEGRRVPRLTPGTNSEIPSVAIPLSSPPVSAGASKLLDELQASAYEAPPAFPSEPPPLPSEPPPTLQSEPPPAFPSEPPRAEVPSAPEILTRYDSSESAPPVPLRNQDWNVQPLPSQPPAVAPLLEELNPVAAPVPPQPAKSSSSVWIWLVLLALSSVAAAAYFMLMR